MIRCRTSIERWELLEAFATARDSITHIPVLVASLSGIDGQRGWAEAAGVDYDGETPQSMAAQIAAVAPALHDHLTGDELLRLLPAGGARNALDCALWDLRAKESGIAVWQAAGLRPPRPVLTVLTIGLGDEAGTRRKARAATGYPILKLKVDAGIDFLVTQLFFDNLKYFQFMERARSAGIGVPILPGIMPVQTVEQIERMTRMCGATLPRMLRAAMEVRRDDPEAARELGLSFATLQCSDLLRQGAPGVHFYTLNRSPSTRAILSALRIAEPWRE